MKRTIFFCIAFCFISYNLPAQATSSAVEITKTWSQNGQYYIKCIPYDNEEPSLRGKSFIFNKNDKLQYTLNRGFNGMREGGNFLGISNDGKTIIYIIEIYANENTDGLKTISIYKNASLVKSFTLAQVTNSDLQREKCYVIYSNTDAVIDWDKSKAMAPMYKKVYKDGVSEQEIFLNKYPVFLNNNCVYITDSKRDVHIIDLKTTNIAAPVSFSDIYPQIKS